MRILDDIERITRPTSAQAQTGCKAVAGAVIGATVTNSVVGALGGAAISFNISDPRKGLLTAAAFAFVKQVGDACLPNKAFLPICTALASSFIFGTRQVQEVFITAATATAATYLPTAISLVAKNYLREAAIIASTALEVYGASKIGYLLPQLIQGDRRQTLRNIGLHWVIAYASSLATQSIYNPNKVAHWTALAGCAVVSMAVRARALFLERAAASPNRPPPQPGPVPGPPPHLHDNVEPAPPHHRVVQARRRHSPLSVGPAPDDTPLPLSAPKPPPVKVSKLVSLGTRNSSEQ